MGRPPLGKRAMSSTERSHRYRAKLAATKPATKPGEADVALSAEIKRLKSENERLRAANVDADKDREIATLRRRAAEAEAATLKQARPAAATSGGTDYAKAYSNLYANHVRLMSAHDALKRQLADARAASPGVTPSEEKAAGRLAREVERLTAEIAKRDALLAADPGEIGKMARELKAAKTRIGSVSRDNTFLRQTRDDAINTQRRVIDVAKRAFRKLRAAPHPDGEINRERNAAKTEVAQAINGIMDEARVSSTGS